MAKLFLLAQLTYCNTERMAVDSANNRAEINSERRM
ncbi:MAG: hypothetical protein JWO06_3679 [Bacteroidota bacterium]|nr:hypothetical protein [Bacteroidota bacterium]